MEIHISISVLASHTHSILLLSVIALMFSYKHASSTQVVVMLVNSLFHFCLAIHRGKGLLFPWSAKTSPRKSLIGQIWVASLPQGGGKHFCEGQSHQNILVGWREEISLSKGYFVNTVTKNKDLGGGDGDGAESGQTKQQLSISINRMLYIRGQCLVLTLNWTIHFFLLLAALSPSVLGTSYFLP